MIEIASAPGGLTSRLAPRGIRRATLSLAHDCLASAVALFVALGLRVGFGEIGPWLGELLDALPAIVAGTAVALLLTGVPSRVWRWATARDLLALARAGAIVMLPFLAATLLLPAFTGLPRSLPVIHWFVFLAIACGSRLAWRSWHQPVVDPAAAPLPAEVLLAGTGDGSAVFIRAVTGTAGAPFRVAGLLDTSGDDVGRRVHDVPVLGRLGDLHSVATRLARSGRVVTRLVVTEELDPAAIAALIHAGDRLGIEVCRMPSPTELRRAAGDGRLVLAPMPPEALLNRPLLQADTASLERLIRGRRVLVTGAGGSIGKELARQIAACGPAHLALLDLAEFNLYSVDLDLATHAPGVERSSHLCDIRDRGRIETLFRELSPELVFHAAALKHVPIVELNPVEGARTNILGTVNVADAACAVGAAAVVMVSTDKAVHPIGMMGATKRVAELYCQALDRFHHGGSWAGMQVRTRLMTVRFGNVLGSSGSVVPLFQRQLAAGGPITVTDPRITRFFMTIQEAVALTLKATTLGLAANGEVGGESGGESDGEAGEIFVLDMGEPVAVVDLARQMIRMAGLEPDRDVAIEFVGLRPGEKLYEELFDAAETRLPSTADGILRARGAGVSYLAVRKAVDEIEDACRMRDVARLRSVIERLVPSRRIASSSTADVA